MSRHLMPRANALIPFALAVLAACQDASDSPVGPRPQFAQGDNGTWTVNTLGDPGDGTCDDAECTLREAIAAATAGDKIVVASGLQGGDIKLAGELLINKSLSIDGVGRIAIDAQGTNRAVVIATNNGPVNLSRLTVKNGHSGGSGGGIFVFFTEATLDSVTVTANSADGPGGGVHIASSTVTIRNSTISDNIAGTNGGGVSISPGASLSLSGSTFSGNQASHGGGIYNALEGTATLERSTISENSASQGAGIYNGGSAVLRSVTLTRNAGSHAAIFTDDNSVASIGNSLLVGNADEGDFQCSALGGITSLGHNLYDLGGCNLNDATDVAVPPASAFTDVLEQELNDNGSPTRTHALITRGRAVDAGYCPGETADQRGFPRPVDDPLMPNSLDACDIGAYELQGPVASVADLMISQAVNKTSVKQGELLTYSVRVQNLGPETAPNVVVTDLLPSGATFVEARHNKGTHTAPPKGETGTVTWSVGDLLDQANEVAEITVTVLVRGRTTITNTASVTGDVADPNDANNSAAIKVSVASGAGGKPGGGKK